MWLCSINSFTNAGVLVQEMNVTPFITNSTTYPDESCAQPETAKLTTFKQTATARVQIAFMFRLRMFASDPKLTANASLYLYLSDQAPPPVLLPGPQGAALTCIERLGNISHAHAGHIKHGGGVTHLTPLPGERPASFVCADNSNPLPKPGEKHRGVIVSITRRKNPKCHKEQKTACVLDTKLPYYLKTETTNQISVVLGNSLLHYRTLWATNWIQSHINTIQLCNKQAWHFNYLMTTKDDRLAVGVASLEEVMRLIRQLSETFPLRWSRALSNSNEFVFIIACLEVYRHKYRLDKEYEVKIASRWLWVDMMGATLTVL